MEIPIKNKNIVALVDAEDYNRVISAGSWCSHYYGHTYYVRSYKHGYLHRFIMKPPKNKIVDHINHDGLDNRKENLKVCTHSQNQKNVRPYKKIGNRGIL